MVWAIAITMSVALGKEPYNILVIFASGAGFGLSSLMIIWMIFSDSEEEKIESNKIKIGVHHRKRSFFDWLIGKNKPVPIYIDENHPLINKDIKMESEDK